MRSRSGASWLRQNGADGQSVISAAIATNRGLTLHGVSVFIFDNEGHFVERVDGKRADLHEGYWEVKEAWVVRIGREPEKFDIYLVSTYLTPDRVTDALGTVFSVSFWEMPALIEVAEKAKLSSDRLRIQYEALMSRPLLCAAMVLLAATVSLRSFRGGGIQTMVIAGLVGGFGFFLLSEVSRQVGVAGLTPPWAAIWLPVVLVMIRLGFGSVAPGGWLSDASYAGTARGLRIVTRHLPAPEGCRPGAFGYARVPVSFARSRRFDAHAQDPSTLAPDVERSSSFPKQSLVGPSRNIDKSQPLYLQGDELIYDTGGNKVIARGNVEIYYNNYILTADQVVYDQSANTLTAVGNVVLKEPNGNIVRADRYTLTDDFRDGFVSQLLDRRRRRHAHRRRAGDAPRRQHDRLHQRPLHALQDAPTACRRCGA